MIMRFIATIRAVGLTLLHSTALICAQDIRLPLIAPNLARDAGTDSSRAISYARFYINSVDPSPSSSHKTGLDLSRPTLVVQCSQMPSGKKSFELLLNFGGVTDTNFYPPWKPSKGELYPPVTQKATYTMEFLGYTKVKPVKRQWEHMIEPFRQLRYNPPGLNSTNMEEISYYFRYLHALPLLRITGEGQTADFLTDALQNQIRKEPLCAGVSF
jgi:hypothetical protein